MTKQSLEEHLFLRPVQIADRKFLEKVYIETRRGEFDLLGWSDEQLQGFLKMQFDLQQQAYRLQFSALTESIIEFDNVPVGRLIVECGDREMRLVDISLLPEFRNRGFGAFLVKMLQSQVSETAGKALTLRVLKTNIQAFKFYKKCGFEVSENGDIFLGMKWEP
jgi:ribosomal protein S18 acetylase RimI-like enzyme